MAVSKVVGLANLNRKIAAMPGAARAAIYRSLDKSADELLRSQKALAERNRSSGKTIESLDKKLGDHPLQIKVFTDHFAARWEEFGTVKTPPIPFFFPAYRILRKKIKSRTRSSISKAVREVARGR